MASIPVITRTEFTVASAALTFQYTFDPPNSLSEVIVETLEPTQESYVIKTLTTDYTIDTSTKVVTFVSLTTRGPVGTKIRIRQDTQRERGVDINAENAFSPSTANRDQEQDFAFMHELETELADVLHKTDRADKWNAEGLEGSNAAPATNGNSWVTQDQLNAAVFDGDVININEPLVVVITGDGTSTTFTLTGARQTTPASWFVFKNGVHQNSDDSSGGSGVYTISVAAGQDDQIVFDTAPENGAIVLCTILQGTVVSKIEDDSVSNDMIQDDAVDLAKINIGAGDAGRMLIFDALGDPVGEVPDHTDISDFDAGVRANRLDQMAVPAANLAMNSQKITGLTGGSAQTDAAAISQLPTDPARIGTSDIANPGLGTEELEPTGFRVHHIAYTFRYRITSGGTPLYATVHCVLNDNTKIWNQVMVTDENTVLRAVLVGFRRDGGNGWFVEFSPSAWNAVDGLLSSPRDVRAVSYGEA